MSYQPSYEDPPASKYQPQISDQKKSDNSNDIMEDEANNRRRISGERSRSYRNENLKGESQVHSRRSDFDDRSERSRGIDHDDQLERSRRGDDDDRSERRKQFCRRETRNDRTRSSRCGSSTRRRYRSESDDRDDDRERTMKQILLKWILIQEKRDWREKLLTVEKFSGDATQYLFWRKRMRLYLRKLDDYGDNDCITEIRNHLTGNALALVQTLLMWNGCVDAIWDRLDAAYDNSKIKSIMAFEQLFATFSERKARTEENLNAMDLCANAFINNVQTLKFDIHDLGMWVIVKQLDPKTRERFLNSPAFLNSRTLPTIPEVIKFIRNEANILRTEEVISKPRASASAASKKKGFSHK